MNNMIIMLCRLCMLLAVLLAVRAAHGAAIIVAPADAGSALKQKADLVCDGVNDEVELLASINRRTPSTVAIERADGAGEQNFTCVVNHSVEWLPGQYHLGASLVIPDACDLDINAEGTELIYGPHTGMALVLHGMNRCRYRFGSLRTAAADVALAISPTAAMPAMASSVSFAGLLGSSNAGTGLLVDASQASIVNNRITGTNIRGFVQGVILRAAGGLCEANWFHLVDIRDCAVGLEEGENGLNANDYFVHLQLNRPTATGIRSGGREGKWQIFIAPHSLPVDTSGQCTLQLTSTAEHNIYELLPPPSQLPRLLNFSQHPNSILLSTDRLPYRTAP